MTDEELLERLADKEDSFVERKPTNAGNADFKRTIVAFANSVPANRTGVLFVGISDKGDITGVPEPDKRQQSIARLAESDCYPPIYVDARVLTIGDKSVVAILVQRSANRPHFAGHAYVRSTSESKKASEALFEEMVLSRDSLRQQLFDWRGKICSIHSIAKQLGRPFPMERIYSDGGEFTIERVTAHFVTFRRVSSSATVSEPLCNLTLSWDDANNRPYIIVRDRPGA